ncbi:uncharacterized protein VP01_935g2 [Puccinia sorghi]|uniref:Uncharacterized protein n=1 Tax=Puccinia sorghi TaxID=27349 RepID=A0A0L6U7C1_9BASI|nr:uncharacterized protein VP01_935g2 [Puccinia sorghi]
MPPAPLTPTPPKPTKQTKTKAVPWDRDGVKGGKRSITIILKAHQHQLSVLAGRQQAWKNQEVIVQRSRRGITQKINDLQTTYNAACDWKQNTGAGILESDLDNGTKTIKLQVFVGTGTHLTPLWDQDQSPNLF